ncbi:MAG: hypothetical protein M3P16_07310 [Chloroflexota bacterium]|nr:hypothetical protein [Chloroflexota bacterium]
MPPSSRPEGILDEPEPGLEQQLGAEVELPHLGAAGRVRGMLVDERDLAARIALRLEQPRSDRLERRRQLVAGCAAGGRESALLHRPSG